MKLIAQELLRKREVRDILLATHIAPATAPSICQRTGIPIARCCRLLRRLEASGLVVREGVQVDHRVSHALYRARLEALRLFLHSGRLWARMEIPTASARPPVEP